MARFSGYATPSQVTAPGGVSIANRHTAIFLPIKIMARIFRDKQPGVAELIYKSYERDAGDWRRDHLGASVLGHRCDRYLWLSFRWALDPKHPGKLLKLFERGNREEIWITRDLRRAGFKIRAMDSDGKQYLVDNGPHLGGSVDGLITGLPDDPDETHILEIKTANRKSFTRLREKGVKSAQPRHAAQMQLYMLGLDIKNSLYVAICKDTDEIHAERVIFDEKKAVALRDKGVSIVEAVEPPDKLDKDFPPCVLTSKDGTRYPCDYFELCHGKAMPERNCRTCVGSTPTQEGTWHCSLPSMDTDLSPVEQREGCGKQISIPNIVNAVVVSVEDSITYQFDDGTQVTEE